MFFSFNVFCKRKSLGVEAYGGKFSKSDLFVETQNLRFGRLIFEKTNKKNKYIGQIFPRPTFQRL